MKKASIDIGSNTVLLLMAEVKGKNIAVLHEDQYIPRLGKNVDSSGNLHQESMDRALEALVDYQKLLNERYPAVDKISVTATSAVRDAANKVEFLEKIENKTGFKVHVLSGLEEAQYTFSGALCMLKKNFPNGVSVMDIGGGSTELSTGRNLTLQDRFSFDMGSVRFTERYLPDERPTEGQIQMCRKEIYKQLQSNPLSITTSTKLVGVAGTVTSLALMEKGIDHYAPKKINGIEITFEQLKKWIEIISVNGSEWLLKTYPVLMKGRADVFLAGLLIWEGIMTYYEQNRLLVSTGGIRHGAILNF